MNDFYQRAWLLYRQDRYDLAEEEIRRSLAMDPDDGSSHALLALCLVARNRGKAAINAAKRAVSLSPDSDYSYFVLATIHRRLGNTDRAREAIDEALSLNPHDADNFNLLARIELSAENWDAMLAATHSGLECDPEHISCLNMHAIALKELHHAEAAKQCVDGTLAIAPNDDEVHTVRGWVLLAQRESGEALSQFKEALRLNATSAWAREGLVESLRSRNIFYRLITKVLAWGASRSWNVRTLFFIGGVLLLRLLYAMVEIAPSTGPVVRPIMVLLFSVYVLSLIVASVFDIALCFDRDGRRALNADETQRAKWLSANLAAAILCGIAYAITGNKYARLIGATLAFASFLLSYTFSFRGRTRICLAGITVAFILVGCTLAAIDTGTPGIEPSNFWNTAARMGQRYLMHLFFAFVGVAILVMRQSQKSGST